MEKDNDGQARHDRLVSQNNEIARREGPKVISAPQGSTSNFIPTAVREISKLPPAEQIHAAREMRLKIQNDLKSDYYNAHSPGHKEQIETVRLLYQAEMMEDGSTNGGNE